MRRGIIKIGNTNFNVDIAETDEEIQQGLMGRTFLPENHGMLFIFDKPRKLSFWMRNTPVPLDIAFINQDGYIESISKMEPLSDRRHTSIGDCQFALEVNKGVFDKCGAKQGDIVKNLSKIISERNSDFEKLRMLIRESIRNY